MSDDIDKIRKELDEVRRLKEQLRDEVDDVRREKERLYFRRGPRHHPHMHDASDLPEPPEPPAPPVLDLGKLTESLEDMMEGLGEQIQHSLRDLDGIDAKVYVPRIRFKRKGHHRRFIEGIPPERIARVISPLGSEERLKILDYLKDGARTFNEIEEHVGRTGSSLTHHLNPLVEAGYVIKGEARGTYYVTVEGRLAYRLAQWLTSRLESERMTNGRSADHSKEPCCDEGPKVVMDFEDETTDREAEDRPEDDEHGSERGEQQ